MGAGSHWGRRKRSWIALVLHAAVVIAALGFAGASAAGAPSWGGQTEIDQPFLAKSLSCPSSSFCVAVADEASFAVYRSGSWIDSGGSSSIDQVSCASSTFCVGISANDASVFNGTTWSAAAKVTASTGFPLLVSVSCASEDFCIAIDQYGNAYSFNGISWSAAGNITGGEVVTPEFAVACVSATFCVAAGGKDTSVYNGITWTQHKVLSTGELDAVTCFSEYFCVAAGTREVRFNGTNWSSPTEIDGEENITSIACESTSTCVAVDGRGYALTSTGATWSAPASIDPFKSNVLLSGYEEPGFVAVSCMSSGCRAVDEQGRVFTLSGSTWNGPAVLGGQLLSVSCPTSSFCTATDNTG